ncbi:hypothetical protein AAFF_G00009470 [Aldrovandia affinis]|uniref:Voltage-dependent calcium channel gamma-like subunit n=1 Tax=Aldrovandia affinis TaxID=143900 RepID=A0AAD7T6G1_9TELE|nr:hypothetical protein AAFF_G00009470 [Aldrovandia affinis]
MTAIKIKAQGAPRMQRPKMPFLEIVTRNLIILCTSLALVLSSIAICDGHWLLADGRMFGLWRFCTVGDRIGEGALPNCTTRLGLAGVEGLEEGLGLCRLVVSLAVVGAIFGLELLVISQLAGDRDSGRRWTLGYALVLLAFVLSLGGVVVFVFLLRAYASPLGFTLAFWCQYIAVFLFLLNGLTARHIQHMMLPYPGVPGKC